MNKTLNIIRHAKSDWARADFDYDRILNQRGRNDAQLIGKTLASEDFVTDKVICSGAYRAKETFQCLNEHLKITDNKIEYTDTLYLASLRQLLAEIENFNNDIDNIVIIGHNPGLTELCNYMTGDDLQNLPTCAVYSIVFPVDDWRAIDAEMGSKNNFLSPRMIKEK